MISIKTLYFDVGNAVNGICDRVYARNRPKSVDDRPDSYIVVFFPAGIYNNEMNDDGSYNDYTTVAQIEVHVRDKPSSKKQNNFTVYKADEKVRAALHKLPTTTEHILVLRPQITLQTDDGDGFSVTIIQGKLRTK